MSMGPDRTIEVNGVSLHVEEYGNGTPVLLLHGWPDSAYVWRNQIPFLTGHGFRVIAPDLRGFGRSSHPVEVTDYALSKSVGDMTGLLDALGLESVHLVGHDWGAAVAWGTAMSHPDRVQKLVVVSVGHPSVAWSLRQNEMAWYQLFFQFEGIAEATLAYDDWAWLRRFLRGAGDQQRYEQDLSRPGALTASLNWYRANLAPKMPGPGPELPPVRVPTLGIGSTGDHYLDQERMEKSGAYVKAPWRYEVIDGASHWIPLDAPDRLNALLLDWLQGASDAATLPKSSLPRHTRKAPDTL
jgi:pimeloyl-ACP methyl ester carboxylesterase